jgi:Domain of unknown function (DUF1844)
MTGDDTEPQVQLSADEDWKNRVKAEDAAIDQQFRDKSAASGAPQSGASEHADEQTRRKPESPPDLGEANFDALVAMLSAPAMVALGAVPNPATKKAEPQLPMARYLIDLLGVLEQRTTGNRSPEESEALEETLHSLRMMYVQRSRMTA